MHKNVTTLEKCTIVTFKNKLGIFQKMNHHSTFSLVSVHVILSKENENSLRGLSICASLASEALLEN